jgi:hypothetical protein
VVIVLSLLLASQKEWLALAIFWILVLVLWLAFFKPTWCNVETSAGKACRNRAHGCLRACHLAKHRRAKNDALWAMVKSRKPAVTLRQRKARAVTSSATHLLTAAARLLPTAERARYADEYRSELWELSQAGDGRIRQLSYALRQLRSAPSMRLALSSPRRRSAAP